MEELLTKEVTESEAEAIAAQKRATEAAEAAKISAENTFNEVVAVAKANLDKLRTEAYVARSDWEVKMNVVTRTKVTAEEAKMRAVTLNT